MVDTLRRIIHDIRNTHDLNEACNLIVAAVKNILCTDICSVYLSDDSREEMVLMATDGLYSSAIGQARFRFGQGLIGFTVSRAEPLNIADALVHPAFLYVTSPAIESMFHGYMCVPMIHRRRVLGVLVVQQKKKCKYSQDDESFLVTLATQLATCISQVEIKQALEKLTVGLPTRVVFFEGIASAPGISIGEAVVVFPTTSLTQVPDKNIIDVHLEAANFKQAVAAELAELRRLSERMKLILSVGDRALLDAYALLLGSDNLVNGTLDKIYAGNWAPGALRSTILEYAHIFTEMDDPYLKERSADILDLGQRLLNRLQLEQVVNRCYPENTILMGEEISVSQFLEVPPEYLKGIVSARGTGTSHVALLARGLAVPAVFGINNLPLGRIHGREVAVDGYTMRACIQPSTILRQAYLKLIAQEIEQSRSLQHLKNLPAETIDGYHLKLYANSGLFADIAVARNSGVEGVGLYRSELHFFLRDYFPGEEEQYSIYSRILRIMQPYPVVLRTLDIGGDKSLPYFPITEKNPFLGWRGIRISLDQPDLFKLQLRAMLRASLHYSNLSILFPMISSVSELEDALYLLNCVHAELIDDGISVKIPRVGIMVEVPSAAYQIDILIRRVDFASIGTNDLTQYLLAVDRNNDRVAKLYDSLHPAVLATIRYVVDRIKAAGKPVSICGEMADDPAAVILLLAMGVDSLSMNLGSILKIKWMVRSIHHTAAKELLSEVMNFEDAATIRKYTNNFLDKYGLSSLLRIKSK